MFGFSTSPMIFDVFPMVTSDCPAVAGLHKTRFPHPWDSGAFHGLLVQKGVVGFVARPATGIKAIGGFVLARGAVDEAEILTLAVDSRMARNGLGWRLMRAAMQKLAQEGMHALFLEVDAGNPAAIGLYRKLGFETVGERKAYYKDAVGGRSTALVMKADLR